MWGDLINGEGLGCEGAPPEERSPKLGDLVSQDQKDPPQSIPKKFNEVRMLHSLNYYYV